ncbi:hypothetical protein ASF36_13980 [Methylobacterium sp. Leaf90]|nr:hypothetical protein ASF36_13980 [Methylobacterium sp. Leaf90]
MGVVTMFLTAIGALASAVFVGLIKDEVSASLPALADKILLFSVKRLPGGDQERYLEEWRAHINEYPGRLSQVFQAARIFRASRRLSAKGRASTHTMLVASIVPGHLCFAIIMLHQFGVFNININGLLVIMLASLASATSSTYFWWRLRRERRNKPKLLD